MAQNVCVSLLSLFKSVICYFQIIVSKIVLFRWQQSEKVQAAAAVVVVRQTKQKTRRKRKKKINSKI